MIANGAMRLVTALAIMACLSTPVAAYTGFLHTGDALDKVEDDILAMSDAELRSLQNYLLECNDRASISRVVLHACRTARLRYQTEYGQSRSIDIAINEIEELVSIRRLITGGAPPFVTEIDAKLLQMVGASLKAGSTRPTLRAARAAQRAQRDAANVKAVNDMVPVPPYPPPPPR